MCIILSNIQKLMREIIIIFIIIIIYKQAWHTHTHTQQETAQRNTQTHYYNVFYINISSSYLYRLLCIFIYRYGCGREERIFIVDKVLTIEFSLTLILVFLYMPSVVVMDYI